MSLLPAQEYGSKTVLGDEGSAGRGSPSARVAFICTANRARSPFAAALLRRHVGELPVFVESFGVLEQAGAAALDGAVRAASMFGIDLSGHRARTLMPGDLRDTQLAIGFEPAHVAAAIATGGSSAERTFLLAELADVVELDVLPWPPGCNDLSSRVAHANARRFAGARLPRAVGDPVGGSDRRFRQTYDEIDRMVTLIGMRLFESRASWAG
jgi:protein-tyrosine-phosphatase